MVYVPWQLQVAKCCEIRIASFYAHGYDTVEVCVNQSSNLFVEKIDQAGLELRKSLQFKALRISSAESIVTKRVALAEVCSLERRDDRGDSRQGIVGISIRIEVCGALFVGDTTQSVRGIEGEVGRCNCVGGAGALVPRDLGPLAQGVERLGDDLLHGGCGHQPKCASIRLPFECGSRDTVS